MTHADWLLDGIIATALPLLAWATVRSPSLHQGVVLFIVLGFTTALAWSRLDAVDVALVEASIGAGLSGALFMSTLSWAEAKPRASAPLLRGAALPLVAAALALPLAGVVLGLPPEGGLTKEVALHLELAEVSHPVTAVLMNFRGYDTLLETIVLLVAALGVRTLQAGPSRKAGEAPPLLDALAGLMLPVALLVSGYFVWRGSRGPGGAFQAGAVLAGGGVVLMLAGRMRGPMIASRKVRSFLLIGPTLFVLLAGAPLLAGRQLLEYPRGWAGEIMMALESTLAIAIAIDLTMFFPKLPRIERETEGDR